MHAGTWITTVFVFVAVMLLVACVFQSFHYYYLLSCLCLLTCIGRAEMSMERGISGLLKDFRARVQCVGDRAEGLGCIVALKGLMWRLMQRDNTGFVSIVPMSMLCSQKWRLGEGYLCCVRELEQEKYDYCLT